jgi:hypothetical protein
MYITLPECRHFITLKVKKKSLLSFFDNLKMIIVNKVSISIFSGKQKRMPAGS